MRIAYLCADRGIPITGAKGAAIHVRAVATALRRRGHDVPILAARTTDDPSIDSLPEVYDIGYDRTLKAMKQAMVKEEGSSVLARELHSLLLNVRTLEVLGELDRQAPVEAIYERYSLWSWAGLRFARQRRIPFVLEMNAPLVEEQQTYRRLHLRRAAEAIELELLRHADSIVVPARELVEYIERRIGTCRRTMVFPNCADLELFAQPPDLPSSVRNALRNRFVVAFVGSLKPWHGVEILLHAFEALCERLPEAHLLIVGDGPLRSTVEEYAQRLGPDRVTSTGSVGHEEVAAWLSAADVGVAPYPALPNFYFSPLKVVEYQAAGLPVVASRIGQLRQLVKQGRNGFLVTPGDSKELSDVLRTLGENRKLGVRLGRSALRTARHSDWDRTAARLETLLEATGAEIKVPAEPPERQGRVWG